MSALMDIPRELRDLIIDEVILFTPAPPPDYSTCKADYAVRKHKIPAFPSPPHSSLLLTSRQLLAETRERLHNLQIPFVMDVVLLGDAHILCTWLSVPAALPKKSVIERVDINFRIPPLRMSDFEGDVYIQGFAENAEALANQLFVGKSHNPVSNVVQRIVSGGDERNIFRADYDDIPGASTEYFIRDLRISFNPFDTNVGCHDLAPNATIEAEEPVLFPDAAARVACADHLYYAMRRYIFDKYKRWALDRSLYNFIPENAYQLYVTRIGDMGFYVDGVHHRDIGIPQLLAPNLGIDTEKALRFRKELEILQSQYGTYSKIVRNFVKHRRSDNQLVQKLQVEEAKAKYRQFRRQNALEVQL